MCVCESVLIYMGGSSAGGGRGGAQLQHWLMPVCAASRWLGPAARLVEKQMDQGWVGGGNSACWLPSEGLSRGARSHAWQTRPCGECRQQSSQNQGREASHGRLVTPGSSNGPRDPEPAPLRSVMDPLYLLNVSTLAETRLLFHPAFRADAWVARGD